MFLYWLLNESGAGESLSPAFRNAFMQTPATLDNHDALGLILMGGEL